MSDFIEVAKITDVPESGKLAVEVDDRYILIIRAGGHYYCLDDVCTHDGGELGDGELDGFCITCPRHGLQFDIRDGRALTMPATEPTGSHSVRIDGDTIWVKLAE